MQKSALCAALIDARISEYAARCLLKRKTTGGKLRGLVVRSLNLENGNIIQEASGDILYLYVL